MLTSKAFSDIVTFSRSSNATRIGPTGRVEYAPHNLLVRSQEFDNASWTKDGTTVTSNSIAAPDGSITADKLVEDSSTGNHWAYASISNTNTTISVYAKAAERNFVALACAGEGLCYFNLSTGAVVSTAANCSTSITSVGNGWYRCVVSATGTGSFGILGVSANGTTVSYAGTTGSGIYLWGAQLSVGPYPLDYTPTTSAAVYGPRFDYDPVTLAARGLLIEESRTNLFVQSSDFSTTWLTFQAEVTTNSTTAPDGTVTADTIASNTSGVASVVYQLSVGSAATHTVSVYAKKSTSDWFQINFEETPYKVAWFNLNTGVVGTVDSGVTASIQSVGNGWYRCTSTFTMTAAKTISMGPCDADASRAATSGKSVYVWGAQLEAGSFATSLIPTVASTVTRSADVASVNTLSPWYSSECTIYCEASVLPGNINNNTKLIFGGGSVGESPAVLEYIGVLRTLIQGVGFPVDAGTSLTTTTKKIAGRFKTGNQGIAVNGSVTSDTDAMSPNAGSAFFIGSSSPGVGDFLNGYIRKVAFYPRALTNAELQALTA